VPTGELEADVLLRSPAPVRIKLPARDGVAARGHFSRWRCVGALDDIDDFQYRACVFSDVCFDTAAADFVFFAPPGNSSPAIIYDHRRGEQHVFRHRRADGSDTDADFVALSKWVPYRPRLSWSPRVETQPLPPEAAASTRLAGLHALSAPFVPTNLGHVAWDEAFPLLVAMAQLGVYSTELHILRTSGCDVLAAGSQKLCAKFASAFLMPLLGSRAHGLQTLSQLASRHRGQPYLCFEELVVGGAYDSFNSEALNQGKEPLLALYRARVLAWHGLPPTAVPSTHTILLVRKEGRRGIHNFNEVRRHVQRTFGAQAEVPLADVQVTGFAGLSMVEQLRLVARTTIAISPCGGISMILPFLPEGAHAILMNYMVANDDARRHGECDGCSWTMEAELWRHVRHVHKQYYQVWGPADFAGGKPGRDSAVRVDVARLERLIRVSLFEMQP